MTTTILMMIVVVVLLWELTIVIPVITNSNSKMAFISDMLELRFTIQLSVIIKHLELTALCPGIFFVWIF